MPRKTSVFAPRDPPQPRKRFDLQESLRRSQTSTHRDQSAKLSQNYKAQPSTYGSRSSSAATILSTVSTNQSRPKVPDFGPAGRLAPPTRNTLGLPKSSSLSSSVSMKKQSQADMIRQARPAPPPPVHNQRKPSHSTAPGLTRSSTLLAPTASSLARMQATVKPPLARPLPVPPIPATPRFAPTSQPFGTASSREHLLFESNFNLPKPAPSTVSHKSSTRMIKSPTKSRMRAQASGLSAVKSKGNLRGEVELQQRRAEIKARQERLAEERGLRALLGEIPGRDVEMS